MATNKYVLSGSFCGIMNNMEEKKYGLDLASLQCTLGLGSVVEQYNVRRSCNNVRRFIAGHFSNGGIFRNRYSYRNIYVL